MHLARMAFPDLDPRDFDGFTKRMAQVAMSDYWFDAATLAAIDGGVIDGWFHIGKYLICDSERGRFVWRLTGERERNDDGTIRCARAVWPD
jgi:hypothetical protein